MPIFDHVHITGNQTIKGDVVVHGSQIIEDDLLVNGNQSVRKSIDAGEDISAGGSIEAQEQLVVLSQPAVPTGTAIAVALQFYSSGEPSQPGLMLKGTDGHDYILYVDTSGAAPTLAIQPA